jgi:hypothetical protein
MRHLARFGTSLLLLFALPVLAGPIADKAIEAEQALAGNNPAAALAAMEAAYDRFWADMPMQVRNAQLVESASGYGVFQPREGMAFKRGEPLEIYIEPLGYGYGNDGLGNKQIALTFDVALNDTAGKTLVQQRDLTKITVSSRTLNRELFNTITLNLGNTPVGRYVATFTVRDLNSAKQANFDIPFEIAE